MRVNNSTNVELCCGQKYTLASRLGGGSQDSDFGSTFRTEFSICEWPLISMIVVLYQLKNWNVKLREINNK